MTKSITKNFRFMLCTGLLGLVSTAAFAQNVPSSVDPGIVTRELERAPTAPRSGGAVIEGQEDQAAGDLSTEKMFDLNGVVVEGATVYTQEQINALVAEYLGKPASYADLDAIARVITRQYREDGYVFSRVILPPQTIEGGVVRMQAIEGRITNVVIEGEYKDGNNLISDLAEKIRSEGPSNTREIERYLLLIDDLPGIKARSLLRPSETPGGGDLLISIEQDPFEGSLALDNLGSRYLGRYRGTLIGAFNSLFGIHDRTTLRGILTSQTEELRFADISHEQQLGTEGLRVKGRYAVTATKPGQELKALEVEGTSHLFDLELLYPVLRSRQYNLNLIGGFTALNSETDLLSLNISRDRVRYFHGGGRFDFTDSLAGVSQIELTAAQGVDLFNATSDGLGRTRANGEHDFTRFNMSAIRIQNIYGPFSVQLSAAGQYTGDSLLASEEFALGGAQFGRAYDSGEITGDKALAGSMEFRYSGTSDHDLLRSYQLYTFYDGGKVWNNDPAVAESAKESLTSVGVGARFNLDYDVTGNLEFNKPLTRSVAAEGDDDSRLFFSVLKRF